MENEDQNEATDIVESSRTKGFGNKRYKSKVISASLNTLAESLIACTVLVVLWFAFKSTPVTVFEMHIGLTVIGYQLLMSHAILCLNSGSGWSVLTTRHRHRLHWVLQLAGSATAIAGSILMVNEKTADPESWGDFKTLHGRFAQGASIFTWLSLINGVTSLYAKELRKYIPEKVAKTSHTICGTAAFTFSSACLILGYHQDVFKEWVSDKFVFIITRITILYTVLVIVAPCKDIWRKMFGTNKKKV